MQDVFLLIVFVIVFLLLLLVAAAISELVMFTLARPVYGHATVGCLLKPRKTLKKLILEIFK